MLQLPHVTDYFLSLYHDNQTAPIFNLSQHPDAKLYFPVAKFQQIYERETKKVNNTFFFLYHVTSIYALVCDTDSTNAVQLTKDYIGYFCLKMHQAFWGEDESLYEVILPLVNLSVNNHNKELLGEVDVLNLVLKTLQLTPEMCTHERSLINLSIAKQLAAKVLHKKD